MNNSNMDFSYYDNWCPAGLPWYIMACEETINYTRYVN